MLQKFPRKHRQQTPGEPLLLSDLCFTQTHRFTAKTTLRSGSSVPVKVGVAAKNGGRAKNARRLGQEFWTLEEPLAHVEVGEAPHRGGARDP
jgi:hypothetical protein